MKVFLNMHFFVLVCLYPAVLYAQCKITAQSPYTAKEWAKIEKLASENGQAFSSAKEAKKYIKAL